MASESFRFEGFVLDARDRQLRRDGVPVEINARYLDALALLVREAGRLVSKDRFLAEVWDGVPVTDEALTQCISTLRRQLDDDPARPRFIETVRKHGYRFVAPVEPIGDGVASATPRRRATKESTERWRRFLALGLAGTAGGGIAGLLGGLVYGFAAAAPPLAPGVGATSVLLVLVCLTFVVALMGGAGVGFGIAAAGFASSRRWLWSVVGGAGGGLLVGAVVKLLALDAFSLLLGRSPGDVTGASEGALLGGAIGLGAWLGQRGPGPLSLRRGVAAAAVAGAAAGVLNVLLGGRMLGGSLDLLVRTFPDSRLRLDPIGAVFGEDGFGPVSQAVTGALEGALFGGCIAAAMIVGRRLLQDDRRVLIAPEGSGP